MDKKEAQELIEQLVRSEFIRYKAYADAYKLEQGHSPGRQWIRIKLTLDEAAAFLGET